MKRASFSDESIKATGYGGAGGEYTSNYGEGAESLTGNM